MQLSVPQNSSSGKTETLYPLWYQNRFLFALPGDHHCTSYFWSSCKWKHAARVSCDRLIPLSTVPSGFSHAVTRQNFLPRLNNISLHIFIAHFVYLFISSHLDGFQSLVDLKMWSIRMYKSLSKFLLSTLLSTKQKWNWWIIHHLLKRYLSPSLNHFDTLAENHLSHTCRFTSGTHFVP